MKGLSIVFFAFLASAAANALERRQLGNLAGLLPMVTPFISPLKPIKVEHPKPEIAGTNIKRMTLKYGPFRLRSAKEKRGGNTISLDPQGTGYAYMAKEFPSNVTVLIPKMLIVHEDGTEISRNVGGVYNHHAFVYDVSRGMRANIQCKDSKRDIAAVNALMGSSADFTPESLALGMLPGPDKLKVGNYLGSNNQLLLQIDLVNYNPEPKNVYVIADLTYIEGKAVGYHETVVHLISVGTCEAKNAFLGGLFVSPPKDKKQWSLRGDTVVKDDGKILAIRGHMHDGGENMVTKLNNRVICDSKAIYTAEKVGKATGGMSGMLSDMTMCMKSFDVKKGDVLSMEANYDMAKHESRLHPGGGMTEQMALMAVVFAQEIK